MAPECPRSRVILDFSEPEALDGGTVYHWDPVNPVNLDSELAVLWEAARCPGGFVEAVANVACVAVPPGYTESGTRWSARANHLSSRGADSREAAYGDRERFSRRDTPSMGPKDATGR